MTPVYNYECSECEHEYEEINSMSSRKDSECPNCGSEDVTLLMSRPGRPTGLSTPGPGRIDPLQDEGFQREWEEVWEDDEP